VAGTEIGFPLVQKLAGELESTLREAFATEGPVIVDAVVAADEIPNLPHFEFGQIDHYAIAKIKESMYSIMGT
jgi:pyruvate dehydrogenase (quinone)